ncbi:MAG: DNA polymerase III subunit gamma/tau [Flavobacteriaceae bacterium]|nr:DNA polymerase III subunit gamma/tau [Flavobacteriaceae bacterium]
MEHFIVSARKYRPQTFEDVVGQHAITNTLENAIKNNHLAQALLFTGPRGVGKTTCARILAKRINQAAGGEIQPDEDFAFNIFELDAASNNSVDDIRNLTDQVRIPPQTGNYKVYIIDEVHMLSQSAFNAFLKTLEEPPAHAIFILATTEKHKIIPTILSRCQIFDFKRIEVSDIKNYLHQIAVREGIEADDDALHIIAQKADGALRDALSIYDRIVSFSGTNITRKDVAENLSVLDYDTYFNATELILSNDIPQLLLTFNDILARGFDGSHFINGLASHFRDLLVAKDSSTLQLLEVGDNAKKQYGDQSKKCEVPFLLKAIDIATRCDLDYKSSKNQRLLVELALMQLASITFEAQKKKSEQFIIPASYYTKSEVKELVKQLAKQEVKQEQVTTKVSDRPIAKTETLPEKPRLKVESRRASALSLSRVHQAKTAGKVTTSTDEDAEGFPEEPFSQEQLIKSWKKYSKNLDKKGEKIMASIMNANLPETDKNSIVFHLPNSMMKTEFERQKPSLLRHLKEVLQNYKLSLKVLVNEDEEKKYAYTPQEKYNKLLEKNQTLAKLKSTFKLDI